MTRTTVVAEESLLLEVKALAEKSGVPFSEIVRRALKEFVSRHGHSGLPSFVGAGASGGKHRLSERAEDLLFEERRKR